MNYARVRTRCSVRKNWLGTRVSSVGSIESDVTFDRDAPSIEGPLVRTGMMMYDYYKKEGKR